MFEGIENIKITFVFHRSSAVHLIRSLFRNLIKRVTAEIATDVGRSKEINYRSGLKVN